MWILLIILFIIFLVVYLRVRKVPKCGSLVLINGGVKTGKSSFCLYLAYRKYRRNLFVWRIKCVFIRILKFLRIKKYREMPLPERPLFYSNIPLKFPYVPLTNDMLTRKVRFAYKSVIFCDEASLIADSMSFGNPLTDEQLLLFVKLIGHETHGGSLFINTQSIADLHHAFKKCVDTYYYIHHINKFVPFFVLLWVREAKFSYDGSSINTYNGDVEESLKLVFMPKKIWKKFSQYAFSTFTDNLPYETKERIAVTLTVDELVTFRKWRSLPNIKRSDNNE